jgi:hypothetical protein
LGITIGRSSYALVANAALAANSTSSSQLRLVPQTKTLLPERRAIASIVLLLAGFSAVVANWRYEVLRFSSPVLNAVALLAGLTLPVVALVIAASRLTGWWRGIASALLALPVVYGTFASLFVTMHLVWVIENGTDRSFESLGAVPVEGGRVGVYRTDCGATCDYGVAVRQERPLLPGVLLVRRLQGFYPAYQATFQPLGPRTVRVSVSPHGQRNAVTVRSRVYVVQPRVYF